MRREFELLLRASGPSTGTLLPEGGTEDLDWGVFLEAAFRHRVAALAGRALGRAGYFDPESRTEHVLDALLAARALNDRRNRILLDEAVRLVRTLRAEGIKAAVRKGAYLTPVVYRDTGLRPMNDIDLFIDPRAARQAAAVLQREGFVPGYLDAHGKLTALSRAQSVFWNVHINTLPTLHRPCDDPALGSVAVDICFSLFLPASGCELPAERLLNEAVSVDIGGEAVPVFRPEHFLLDVAAHLYKESTTLRYIERGKHQRLLQYVDIVSVVRAHPGLDWDLLAATAEESRASPNLYFALAHTERLFPGTVPAAVLDRVAAAGGCGERFLDQYGALDLPRPLSWTTTDIAERLFSDERPAAASQSPV